MKGSNIIHASIFMLLLAAGIFAPLAIHSAAATSTALSVSPVSVSPSSPGQTFQVQVIAYLVFNLTGFQFQLNFNTTLVQCINASLGNLFPGPPNSVTTISIDNTHGFVSIQSSLQGNASPVSGNIPLLSTYFRASYATIYPKPRDTSSVTITGDKLYAPGSQLITHVVSNGTYTAPYAAPQLSLSLKPTRSNYLYDSQTINVSGVFTGNGSPIPNALVALEIENGPGSLIVARTLQTSTYPPNPPLQVSSLVPCDSFGDPTSSFEVGNFVGMKVTVHNSLSTDTYGLVMVDLFDSSNATLGAIYLGITIPASGSNTAVLTLPLQYDPNSLFMTPPTSGTATAYAGVWSNLVENGGVPLSVESQANFNIVAFKQGQGVFSNATLPTGTYQTNAAVHFREGVYSNGIAASYTIMAGASFMGSNVTNSTQVTMTLGGDVNLDGKVNLSDLVYLARAYGSKPGDPRWNPACDFQGNGVIGLGDLVILASNYGKGTV